MNSIAETTENIRNLCRVCSSPGSYDIFCSIPGFLHSDKQDRWKSEISKMLAEVTGLSITRNDGLPEKICGLCISYLKHAVLFRNRAVQTRLSLLSATYLTFRHKMEMNGDCENLDFPLVNHSVACDRVPTMADSVPPRQLDFMPPASTPEVKSANTAATVSVTRKKDHRFFDYKEKTFVEDDITQWDTSEGVEINHPEVFVERKCGFCLHRFMLEDTYEKHLDDCIYRTLIEFIKNANYFMELKAQNAISNLEFVRRIVFSIRKVNQTFCQSYQPPVDDLLRPSLPRVDDGVATNHFTQSSDSDDGLSNLMATLNNSKRAVPMTRSDGLPCNSTNSFDIPFKITPVPETQDSNGVDAGPEKAKNGVLCSMCGKSFLLISHLDAHVIKCHK